MKKDSWMIKNKECRMCPSTNFGRVIDFGYNPLVNSLLEQEDLEKSEPVFPLIVKRCKQCSLVQIQEIVDSYKIYRKQDYLYFSGEMPGLADYFSEYADDLNKRFLQDESGKKKFVVEIGSNDGTMLQFFKSHCNVLGVDPSTNVVVRALKNGITTLSDFFTERLAKNILKENGPADLIYGNNCIAHLNDLRDLMRGVSLLLKDGGTFVVECNYWGGMVKNKNYALIYHDHFSYFTLKNWADFAPKYGLGVFDAIVTPAQGGSLRVFMQKAKNPAMTERCKKLYNEEMETKLNSQQICDIYRRQVLYQAKRLHNIVEKIRFRFRKKVAGYGAAAKGFSVLKLAELDYKYLDYFVDDSPAKQGKYTPVDHIPVISRAEAEKQLPDYFFITAPNYEKQIIEKEKAFIEKGGKFITCDGRVI